MLYFPSLSSHFNLIICTSSKRQKGFSHKHFLSTVILYPLIILHVLHEQELCDRYWCPYNYIMTPKKFEWHIQPQILATLEKLRQLWDTPGDYLKSLDSILKTTLKDWNINMSEAALVSFKCNIQEVYVDALLENITNRFPDAGIISAFSIFDPLKLPASEERVQQERYGESSLNTLVEHYGSGTSPIVSSVDAKNVWEVL